MNVLPYKIACMLCFAARVGFGQDDWQVAHSRQIARNGFQIVHLDTLTLDTLRINFKTSQRVVVSKEGVELSRGVLEGFMGSECGCNPRPHGFWVEKYRNGNLKSVGTYRCATKTGTWTYYHENGNLAKIETLELPYLTFLTEHGQPWDTLKNRHYLQSGAYIAYFPNGIPKIEGRYEIVEALSPTDTLVTLDPDTYEELEKIVSGHFWIPVSVKVGIWKEYSEQGVLIKTEEIKPVWLDDKRYRRIADRYYELFFSKEK